ncbi:hypothetical protein [Helicobacter sp. 23-1045]
MRGAQSEASATKQSIKKLNKWIATLASLVRNDGKIKMLDSAIFAKFRIFRRILKKSPKKILDSATNQTIYIFKIAESEKF